MAKSSELIIENWQQGIAPSPEQGFGMMKNVDIYTNPGSVRLTNLQTKKSASLVGNIIIGFRRDPLNNAGQNIWAYDKSAIVYKSADGGTTWSIVTGNSSGTGTGIGLWKDYLFVATTTKLDVYGPLSGAPVWSTAWQTLTSDTFHTMLESVDDKLYICNNKYVAQLKELTTFLPGTGSTYTWTAAAITLAAKYHAKCLADLGSFLMVGTWVGLNIYEFKIADVFPYARTDLTLGIPLKLNKNGINAMLSVNNRLYIQAGISGEIFESDSVTFVKIGRMPNYVMNFDSGVWVQTYPEAIMWHRDKLYFGVSTGGGNPGNCGVYSLIPGADQNVMIMENTISTGDDGTTGATSIGALLSTNVDVYISSFQGVSSFGIDMIDNSQRVDTYGGYIDSPLYQVGEALNKKTLTSGEIYLRKPLVTGQGVRIQYRKDLTSAFTTVATLDYSTYQGSANLQNIEFPSSVITNSVFIQFRILLQRGSDNTNSTPELRRVIFRPST